MSHAAHIKESWTWESHLCTVCCSVLHCVAVCCSEWVMKHISLSLCNTYQRVIWMSQFIRVNESWSTCQWVMSHIWMSRVTCINAMSCVTCINAMSRVTCINAMHWYESHVWMSHGAHINALCVTHNNESCHVYKCNESCHVYTCNALIWVTHVIESWSTYQCVVCHT